MLLFQESGSLDNFFGIDKGDAQSLCQLRGIGKSEHFKSAFAVELPPLDAIHMRENQVDRFLGETVKGGTFRNDGPK